MLFSSITFLFGFLPVVLLVYYISPKKIRNFILMIFSMLFYAWGEPLNIVVMLVSIIICYAFSILSEHFKRLGRNRLARLMLISSIIINLAILFYYKYFDFFVDNINRLFKTAISLKTAGLPLGISFYTFQLMSYSVDVYVGRAKLQKNIVNLAAYISFFPQLIAGPIVRYDTIADELVTRNENIDDFGEGVKRFIVGLGKKVLIANVAGDVFKTLSALPDNKNTIILSWICSIAFSLQIYFDFSGYSDMAIGLGRMFGFHFMENFNYPYISKSITEFWRRWHISLSGWFRDYVYIPLGGNRKGTARQLINLFIVWFLTGFWHGAGWNYIIWGLYYFVLLVLEKKLLSKLLGRLPGAITSLYTLIIVNFGWVIFANEDFTKLKTAVYSMLGINGLRMCNKYTLYMLCSYGPFLLLAFIGATPLPEMLGKRITKVLEQKNRGGMLVSSVVNLAFLFFVLLLSTAFLASDAFNPFLYFRF